MYVCIKIVNKQIKIDLNVFKTQNFKKITILKTQYN
jgi:hypothetical protein